LNNENTEIVETEQPKIEPEDIEQDLQNIQEAIDSLTGAEEAKDTTLTHIE